MKLTVMAACFSVGLASPCLAQAPIFVEIANPLTATGGVIAGLAPWTIRDEGLAALAFQYSLSGSSDFAEKKGSVVDLASRELLGAPEQAS